MPARDGTGPMSQGPKTGRQMGDCANMDNQGFTRCGSGEQKFARRGKAYCNNPRGRRFLNQRFASAKTDGYQKEVLEKEVAELEGRLNDVKAQLGRLNSSED